MVNQGRKGVVVGRKVIGIEALLTWAYRQELCKAGSGSVSGIGIGGSWAKMDAFRELGCLVDVNRWGCVPDFSSEGEPDADALRVGQAVEAFYGEAFDASGVDLLGDLPDITAEERTDCHARGIAAARLGGMAIAMAVTVHARLQRRPAFGTALGVERKMVRNAQGGVAWFRKLPLTEGRTTVMIEGDGFDRVKRRPHKGAYRKTFLTPDPARLVTERAEYQGWVLCLAALTASLTGVLERFDVQGSDAPLWPWERSGGEGAQDIHRANAYGA